MTEEVVMKQLNEVMPAKYPGHEKATISEVFYFSSLEKDEDSQVRFIQEFMKKSGKSDAIMNCLVALYHPKVVFDLPEGHPGFKENDSNSDRSGGSLYGSIRRFGYFIKGHREQIKNKVKVENLFIQTLESITAGDAYTLIAIKDKDGDYIGVSQAVAHSLFPQYIEKPVGGNAPKKEEVVKQKDGPSKAILDTTKKRAPRSTTKRKSPAKKATPRKSKTGSGS